MGDDLPPSRKTSFRYELEFVMEILAALSREKKLITGLFFIARFHFHNMAALLSDCVWNIHVVL